MNDTPRTDDQIGYKDSTMAFVRIDFAHQLERELTAAKSILERLLTNYDEENGVIHCQPEPSCNECTSGCTPLNHDKGLCAFHAAKQLTA